MAIDVKPTRSELMKLKQKIKLANSGHNLLKKKRDGLIMEFFEILKKAKTVRQELIEYYRQAVYKMNIARAAESDVTIRSVAMAIAHIPVIQLKTKNIMGVVVPEIESENIEKDFTNRGYGFVTVPSKVDEAAYAYEKTVEKAVRVAEIETKIKKLLAEIEKTKRRANALEFAVIPQLTAMKKLITLRLEEIERENVFRLKRMKG